MKNISSQGSMISGLPGAFTLLLTICMTGLFSSVAGAANAAYQNYFFSACNGATGALAARCNETVGGTGNLSGDSEDSLNPGQFLSSNDRSLSRARDRLESANERSAALREGIPAENSWTGGRWGVFINGNYSWFDRQRGVSDQERAFDGDSWKTEIGADVRISPDFVIGALLGFEREELTFAQDSPGTNFSPQDNQGQTESDTFSISLFSTLNLTDSVYLDLNAGTGFSDYTLTRKAIFQESRRIVPQTNLTASAETDGQEYWAGIGTGYDLNFGAFGVTPYVRGTWVRSEIDGYTENDRDNTGLNKTVAGSDRTSLTTDVGLKASYTVVTGYGVWIPYARAEWEHEFDKDAQTSSSSYALDTAGNVFTTIGDEPDRDYFNLGFGLSLVMPQGVMGFVDWEILLGYNDYDNQRITAGFKKEF